MIRSLAVVAIGGAVLSVICIGASGGTRQGSWHTPSMSWNFGDDDAGHGPPLRLTGNELQISRDLPWSGGESLVFDLPAAVTYTQGPIARITLTGPDALVDHVVLHGTSLKLDRSIHGLDTDHALHIAITGPSLHEFQIDSALKLDILAIQTDALRVQIDGAGKVTAKGSARRLKLQIDGAADADLGALVTTDATITIDGLGHVIAAPTGDANIQIDGAGKVTLTRRPAHLSQQIDGAGSVTQPEGQTL